MKSEDIGRRSFLTAATGAAAFTILKPQVVRGMQANSALRGSSVLLRGARHHAVLRRF